jgi:sec-independent protein translocase protein TatA
MMAIMNGVEVIIIILVGLLIIFGAKKIPELAKSFGKATSEFEKARIEARRELHDIKNKDSSVLGREKLEAIAETLGIDYTNKNDEQLRFAIETEINKNKNK